MRGTRAKALRREARGITMQQPVLATSFLQEIVKQFKMKTGKLDELGKPEYTIIDRTTFKWTGYKRLYRDLKKAWRQHVQGH